MSGPVDDDTNLPVSLPYRSRLLGSLAALFDIWGRPGFQRELALASGLGTDVVGLQIIRLVTFRQNMRPSELARELGTARSNVSRALNRLARSGLIVLAPDDSDGRAVRIALTEDGTELADRIYDVGDAMVAEIVDGWSSADVAAFIELMQRFTISARDFAQALGDDEDGRPGRS